jgi:hypothetical protein
VTPKRKTIGMEENRRSEGEGRRRRVEKGRKDERKGIR